MNNQKDQILKTITIKHIETINTDKLNTVNGGRALISIVSIDA